MVYFTKFIHNLMYFPKIIRNLVSASINNTHVSKEWSHNVALVICMHALTIGMSSPFTFAWQAIEWSGSKNLCAFTLCITGLILNGKGLYEVCKSFSTCKGFIFPCYSCHLSLRNTKCALGRKIIKAHILVLYYWLLIFTYS